MKIKIMVGLSTDKIDGIPGPLKFTNGRGGFTMGSLGTGEPSDFWKKKLPLFLKI